MMPPILLLDPGQETRHIDQREQRNVEGIAEADEARGFVGGIDVERARQHVGLVGDDADRAALQAAEADHDVRREAGLNLQEILVVDDPRDHGRARRRPTFMSVETRGR